MNVLHAGPNPGFGSLTWEEFQYLLSRATRAINDRPLGTRVKNKASPGFCPITPNMLLKGHFRGRGELVQELTDVETMGSLVNRLVDLEQRW